MIQRRLPSSMLAVLCLTLFLLGCTAFLKEREAFTPAPPGRILKKVSFSILEDYDKGEALSEIARDFELMKELEIDTWRGSFGWDDFEPARGNYDFTWLHQFADLAEEHGIKLRPYVGYTPEWAARGGEDDAIWNDPPKNLEDWYNFVYRLVTEMKRHPNVLSYEIYNEENVPQWWEGSVEEYHQLLLKGAAAIRQADPNAPVFLGGLVFPDVEFMEAICTRLKSPGSFDVASFHAYPETWTPETVVVENYLDVGYRRFAETIATECKNQPIWINEAGYATAGKSERDQANGWARSIATFLAIPEIEHIGIYEIKDLKPESPAIGDMKNHSLGLTGPDRKKKEAFYTIDLLTDLLDVTPLTLADADLTVTATDGKPGSLYHHLFIKPDGSQIVFVWDRSGSLTLDLRIAQPGAGATEYLLDGTALPYPEFDSGILRRVKLTPGEVRIFEIRPS